MAYLDAILIFSLASITALMLFVFMMIELEYRNCRRERKNIKEFPPLNETNHRKAA